MNEQKFGPMPIPALAVGGGAAGFILRLLMLKTGYDAEGIQISGSFPFVSLWILSALVLAGLAYLCLGMGRRCEYSKNFHPCLICGGCGLVAGVMLFVSRLIALLSVADSFDTIVAALGLAGGLSLCVRSALRCRGKAWLAMDMTVAMSLAAILIARFRHWTSDPLLGDYCFQLLANVCSMLAAYYLGGFCLDKGKRRISIFFSMSAVFFSMISLADGGLGNLLFNGAMILFLLSGCCSLRKPARPHRRPEDFPQEVSE